MTNVQRDLLPGIGMMVLCTPTPTTLAMRIYPDFVGIFHSTLIFSLSRITYLFMFAGQRCGMGVVGVVGVVGVTVCGLVTVCSVARRRGPNNKWGTQRCSTVLMHIDVCMLSTVEKLYVFILSNRLRTGIPLIAQIYQLFSIRSLIIWTDWTIKNLTTTSSTETAIEEAIRSNQIYMYVLIVMNDQ